MGDDASRKTVSVYLTTLSATPTVNLWGGKTVSFSDTGLGECNLVAVDNEPEANWEHSVSYYCVDNTNNKVDQQDSTSPVYDFPLTYASGYNPSAGEVWQPYDPYVWSHTCTNDCSNNYALLISGGNDRELNNIRYWNDIAFMFITLKEYGYDMTNKVTVMMANGAGTGEKDRRNSTTGVVDLAATPSKDAQHDNFPRNLDGLTTTGAPPLGNETILNADKTSILNKLDKLETRRDQSVAVPGKPNHIHHRSWWS